jgi:glycosyltransferase involved in cell wall biosynthesis
MKRILHLLNSNDYSGAEKVVIQIINFFKSNSEIQITYSSPIGKIKNRLTNENISYLIIKKSNLRSIGAVIKKVNPDIIHCHDYRMTIYASFFKKKNRIIISHLHNNSPWIKKRSLRTFFFYIISARINKILIVSSSIINEFYYGKKLINKTQVIGNPLSHHSNLNITMNKEYDLLFVGRFTKPKNPELFAQFIQRLTLFKPNIRSVMIGQGDLKDGVIDYIKKNNLSDNIKVLNFQNNIEYFYLISKILYVPSSWEGFGLVAFEALSASIPVIAHPVGGLVNLIDHNCGLLTYNQNQVLDEVIKLLDDKEYYNQKSQAAKNKAISLVNVDSYYQKLSEIYGLN